MECLTGLMSSIYPGAFIFEDPRLRGECSLSGLYPLTYLAWVALPGDESPASMALWVVETHKPPNHDKVALDREIVIPTLGVF